MSCTFSVNNSDFFICLFRLPIKFANSWTQIRPDETSGTIWVKPVCHIGGATFKRRKNKSKKLILKFQQRKENKKYPSISVIGVRANSLSTYVPRKYVRFTLWARAARPKTPAKKLVRTGSKLFANNQNQETIKCYVPQGGGNGPLIQV